VREGDRGFYWYSTTVGDSPSAVNFENPPLGQVSTTLRGICGTHKCETLHISMPTYIYIYDEHKKIEMIEYNKQHSFTKKKTV